MINFVSIIKYADGAAAYQVKTSTGKGYTASLVKNTGQSPMPEQIIIEAAHMTATDNNDLLLKLVTAIKKVEADLSEEE